MKNVGNLIALIKKLNDIKLLNEQDYDKRRYYFITEEGEIVTFRYTNASAHGLRVDVVRNGSILFRITSDNFSITSEQTKFGEKYILSYKYDIIKFFIVKAETVKFKDLLT